MIDKPLLPKVPTMEIDGGEVSFDGCGMVRVMFTPLSASLETWRGNAKKFVFNALHRSGTNIACTKKLLSTSKRIIEQEYRRRGQEPSL